MGSLLETFTRKGRTPRSIELSSGGGTKILEEREGIDLLSSGFQLEEKGEEGVSEEKCKAKRIGVCARKDPQLPHSYCKKKMHSKLSAPESEKSIWYSIA